jgi:hypothetical protein
MVSGGYSKPQIFDRFTNYIKTGVAQTVGLQVAVLAP